MAEEVKIDSNSTTMKMAAETSVGVLPGSPLWYEMEPNTYSDFGAQLALVARNPINSGRQRKKGVITDLDASGGFNQDVTFKNMEHLWPSLMMTTRQSKLNYTGAASSISEVGTTATTITATGVDLTADIDVGMIFFISGLANDANNGLAIVTAVAFTTDTTITFAGSTFTTETPGADFSMQLVGFQFTADDAGITAGGGVLPQLTSTADLSNLGLQVGEFVFVGGDAASTQFTNASNNGFVRVSSIADVASGELTFDKTGGGADGQTEMITEALAGGETLQIFFGSVIRNVRTEDPLFNRQTWTIERSLGIPNPGSTNDVQAEALVGSVLNEFAVNVAQADKITTDATFIATDKTNFADTDTKPSESGSDAVIEAGTAYNTSSDFSRIKMALVRPGNAAAPEPLFAFLTELTINVNNNVTPNKAVGCLGAFDLTVGTFEVSGSVTAYFADVASVNAVRNNADVTLDVAIVKDFGSGNEARKTGLVWDIPLIALGDGRLNVVQDEAVTIPLDVQAAEYEEEGFGYTLMLNEFEYLPNAADFDIC